MIIIEQEKYDIDKYCTVCNAPDKTVKSIKISVKDNNCCFNSFSLCRQHRKELLLKLADELI